MIIFVYMFHETFPFQHWTHWTMDHLWRAGAELHGRILSCRAATLWAKTSAACAAPPLCRWFAATGTMLGAAGTMGISLMDFLEKNTRKMAPPKNFRNDGGWWADAWTLRWCWKTHSRNEQWTNGWWLISFGKMNNDMNKHWKPSEIHTDLSEVRGEIPRSQGDCLRILGLDPLRATIQIWGSFASKSDPKDIWANTYGTMFRGLSTIAYLFAVFGEN